MIQSDTLPATAAIEQTAEAIVSQYRAAPSLATERAIAVLALWVADAIAAGRLAPTDADVTLTSLWVELGDMRDGPELSDDTDQLLLECMSLHDWGTDF